MFTMWTYGSFCGLKGASRGKLDGAQLGGKPHNSKLCGMSKIHCERLIPFSFTLPICEKSSFGYEKTARIL